MSEDDLIALIDARLEHRLGVYADLRALDEPLELVFAKSKLKTRIVNWCANDGIVFVGDLIKRTEHEMMRTPYLGRVTVDEIKLALSYRGLCLGMDGLLIDRWVRPDWPSTRAVGR